MQIVTHRFKCLNSNASRKAKLSVYLYIYIFLYVFSWAVGRSSLLIVFLKYHHLIFKYLCGISGLAPDLAQCYFSVWNKTSSNGYLCKSDSPLFFFLKDLFCKTLQRWVRNTEEIVLLNEWREIKADSHSKNLNFLKWYIYYIEHIFTTVMVLQFKCY